MAHACNPRYLGGRDQLDHGLKPAWGNSSRDPISKNPITKKKKTNRKNPAQKRAGGVAQSVGPEFKPKHRKKKPKNKVLKVLSCSMDLCLC
jgi:hypothetical protein